MKPFSLHAALAAALAFMASVTALASTSFDGAIPEPIGLAKEAPTQLRIRFPEEMLKEANKEAFKVSCLPELEGFSGWADNNQVWTFDFKARNEWQEARMVGGAKCLVTQAADVRAASGKVWKAGTISYEVITDGPKVQEVIPAQGFKGTLREADPVLLIIFDGPVDRAKFFADQSGWLNYVSSNAPSEKLALTSVPEDQTKKIFEIFKQSSYLYVKYEDQNWILATVKGQLIPGAQVKINIEHQSSAYSDVKAQAKFSKDFQVRSAFQAEIQCANSSSKAGTCMPNAPISVTLNGLVKWADMREAYIEYLPFKSDDHKRVRTFAEIPKEKQVSFWDDIINHLAEYFPFLARFSDTVVSEVVFNVQIEPQTAAKVVLPKGLTDLDGRILSNALAEFRIKVSGMEEFVRVPHELSFFEKNIEKLYLPVGVVNLNQKILIRKTGTDDKQWQPIQDFPSMINVIRAYANRGETRKTKDYVSPLAQLKIPSIVNEQQLSGHKNRPTVLQVPFPNDHKSGLYAAEVSSPKFEEGQSDAKNNSFYNPKYVLSQVTDLAIHLKKGRTSNVAWVTHLSSAQPVAGATVEIYNCRGEVMQKLTTDASGLATYPTQKTAGECGLSAGGWSPLLSPEHYFVGAKAAGDMVLIHSSWTSQSSYAMGAPGVEYFYSEIRENEPNYHAVIGVNLVKPGQKVPVELIAKVPDAKGFHEVDSKVLPSTARVQSDDDDQLYYDFPLTWVNGTAQFSWQVPADVRLGRYTIAVGSGDSAMTVPSGDIEVAEFKIPLMSGIIAFPNQELVKPDSIPVNTVIRYANGVGAKGVNTDLSYYFARTSIENKELPNFVFGTGKLDFSSGDESGGENVTLPSSQHPAVIQGIATAADGSISRDIGAERAAGDGRTLSEVLKQSDRPQKLVLRVRYQDQIGEYQTLSQSKVIYNSSTYVGTKVVSGTRSDAKLQIAVVDVQSKVVTDQNDLDLKVLRIETRIIGEELYGGLIKNTIEREVKPVHWQQSCRMEGKVVTCPVGTLKDGSYALEVVSKSSGQAAHQLFKVDTNGRVYGPNDYYSFGDDEGSRQLPLALDKKSYKEGERAVVSFSPPFKTCQTLVTIERSDVMQAMVVPNACEAGQVQVPVQATLAPNAFVSVYAVTGRAQDATVKIGEADLGRPTYRLGYANMKVNWQKFKSTVTVKTDKEKYEPGQDVNVTVNVAADQGKLSGTRVTLVAFEEKILELKPNETFALLESMMQMREHSVETVTQLERIETITGENADQAAAGISKDARKGGDEGGDGTSKAEFKRKLFDALVAFQPNVSVENGVAKFSFKANDSLTKFKIVAIAVDGSQKFGTGSVSYLSEKDTQAYSNVPSVAHTGDDFPLRVTVQNNSAADGKFTAEITATVRDQKGNIIAQKKISKDAMIPKSGSQAIEVGKLPIDESASRIEYQISVYDQNGKLVDRMEPAPQMILPSVPLSISDSLLSQVENGSLVKNLVKDPSALAGQGQLQVTAAKSLVAGSIVQIGQRMDREVFADLFITGKLSRALVRGSDAKPDEVKAVLESLVNQTDGNGFVKFFPQSRSGSVLLTAWVINSLGQEPWAVKLFPQALTGKWKTAIGSVLDKTVDPQYVGKTPMNWMIAQVAAARAALVLNDAALVEQAKAINAAVSAEMAQKPSPFGLPLDKWPNFVLTEKLLLETAIEPSSALNFVTYKTLTGASRLVYAGNQAQLNGSPNYDLFYSDETIETADLLLALSRTKGEKSLAKNLALGLADAHLKGWYNVSTMLSVAQALKGFGRAYESEVVTGIVTLAVPEQRASVDVDLSNKVTGTLTSDWTDSKASVHVKHAGQGQPWVSVQALQAIPLTAPRGQGLSIEKSVRNINRDSGFQAGDVIEVTLKINSSSVLRHVALMDPIPAGANILADAYGEYSSGQKSYSGYKLYFEALPSGAAVVKYQYQLNNPGKFNLPPTHAEGLFTPSIFADLPNQAMIVQ